MIYFIADTHFYHKGSLNWPAGKARPFSSVNEMNDTIIHNWNVTVTPADTVYHLGDFAYKCSASQIKNIFVSLNGNIVFIKGNHDGITLKANSTAHRFVSVHDRVVIDYNNQILVLDHYPIYSWLLKNRGSIHLHGHVHGTPTNISGKIMDVSCEVINYTPISIDEVITKFNNNEEL